MPVPAGDQAASAVPMSEWASDPAEQPAPMPRVRSLDPADHIGADERVSVQAAAGVRLGFTPGQQRIELTGTAVDSTLMEDLKAWLRRR
ncbi:hypothetical protein [Phaeobacter inhibens]|uniref:hypothetical protein n=1 Tax=Phaeobacter inhibens TaxID=221822 RepID=UPI0021A7058C|nr:hypothetical protein [Phaeobacter inhibens]